MFRRSKVAGLITGLAAMLSAPLWADIGQFTDSGQIISGELESTTEIAIGDMDNDGDSDVVAVQSGINVWLSDAQGSIVLGTQVDDFSSGIQLADIDLDGDLDVVSRNFSGLILYLNDGSGGLVSAVTVFSPGDLELIGMVARDFDGDTDVDIVPPLEDTISTISTLVTHPLNRH